MDVAATVTTAGDTRVYMSGRDSVHSVPAPAMLALSAPHAVRTPARRSTARPVLPGTVRTVPMSTSCFGASRPAAELSREPVLTGPGRGSRLERPVTKSATPARGAPIETAPAPGWRSLRPGADRPRGWPGADAAPLGP